MNPTFCRKQAEPGKIFIGSPGKEPEIPGEMSAKRRR